MKAFNVLFIFLLAGFFVACSENNDPGQSLSKSQKDDKKEIVTALTKMGVPRSTWSDKNLEKYGELLEDLKNVVAKEKAAVVQQTDVGGVLEPTTSPLPSGQENRIARLEKALERALVAKEARAVNVIPTLPIVENDEPIADDVEEGEILAELRLAIRGYEEANANFSVDDHMGASLEDFEAIIAGQDGQLARLHELQQILMEKESDEMARLDENPKDMAAQQASEQLASELLALEAQIESLEQIKEATTNLTVQP